MSKEQTPDISLVLACYCEEPSLRELYARIVSAMQACCSSYEIIFVNDGSTDNTLPILLELFEHDPSIVIVSLKSNSGQWPAMTAGISESQGRAIAFMDCDLQLDPADIPRLVAKFHEGYDLVGGRRIVRHDSSWRRLVSAVGNIVLSPITKGQLQDIGCSMKVMDARHLRAFEFGPMTPFRPLQVVASMSAMCEVPVSHSPRRHGDSNWGGGVLIKNFSLAMLDLLQGRIRYAGIACWVLALALFTIHVLVSGNFAFTSWPLALAALALNIGLLFVTVDLLILSLVARRVRPAYVVEHVYRNEKKGAHIP